MRWAYVHRTDVRFRFRGLKSTEVLISQGASSWSPHTWSAVDPDVKTGSAPRTPGVQLQGRFAESF